MMISKRISPLLGGSTLRPIWDHHTKRKKSYAKFENSKGQSPPELAGVSANEVEVKGYQITSCRKKGALMKFYDVACAPPFRSTSAISQRALLSFISSSMPLIALLLGMRLPSGRRRERSR